MGEHIVNIEDWQKQWNEERVGIVISEGKDGAVSTNPPLKGLFLRKKG